MSHAQAFHTSCRNGLSGHAGFQFNAASSGLDERQLSQLAAAHAGYRAAPDTPMEPDATQIEQLPVSLRYLPVEGVGPAISRTAYVGREFRGRDGEPDSGRFGNYFSHIVVGEPGGAGAFDGLMPIELWAAPHWSTAESEAPELPPLGRLEPGPVDLDAVLAALLPARRDSLAAVLDACFGAVLGGPRVVLVEPDPDLAFAWIAWVSFALPRDRVDRLTFSTFDGQPRVAEAVQVCVTTPACDLDFPHYELGSAVTIVDTGAPQAAEHSLYARVAAALAEGGGEAVAAATRDLDAGLDLDPAGACLAVAGRRADLVRPGEAAAVLATLRGELPRLSAEAALSLAAAMPEQVDSPAALEWSRLHAAARQGEDSAGTDLVDLTLSRVLGALGSASEIEPVALGAPLSPSVTALAGWSAMVSAAAGSERLGGVIEAGARLRLVGRNSALDRELVVAIAGAFDDSGVRSAYDALAAEGHDPVTEGVALEIAARAGAGGSLAPLRHVARHRVAREAVRARAEAEDASFEMTAAWEVLRVEESPSGRPAAVARLAGLATTEGQAELIRGLYGGRGPSEPADHAELLDGWAAAGRSAPPDDYRRALSALAALPLRREPAGEALFTALDRAPKSLRSSPEYIAWWLMFESPPRRRAFASWAVVVTRAGALISKMPEPRLLEVRLLAASGAAWRPELGAALGQRLAQSADPEGTVALAFAEWERSPRRRRVLLEKALPRATRDLPPRRLEGVGERLDDAQRGAWEEWLEEHPPSRAVSRAVRGVLRRGEGGR